MLDQRSDRGIRVGRVWQRVRRCTSLVVPRKLGWRWVLLDRWLHTLDRQPVRCQRGLSRRWAKSTSERALEVDLLVLGRVDDASRRHHFPESARSA